MKIQLRLILSLLIVISIGFYFLFDFMVNDLRPRYLESVEESMSDTAYILASFLETEIKNKKINFSRLKKAFDKTHRKRFSAKIYQLTKTNVSMNVYVVNEKGMVLYDSDNKENMGKDFSQWNDVVLIFRGEYGVRSTRIVKEDPATAVLYVAAPIKYKDKIIGAVTVAKPQYSIQVFLELAKKKFLLIIILTFIVIILISIIISAWITKPIIKLINYVKSIQDNKKIKLPKLGATEIKDLGVAFEELVDKLEGKKYIENYIHSLTHEIKSPLSSITGAAELLEEDLPHDQKIKFYKNIRNETKRIKEITDKLLNLSTVERQKGLKEISSIKLFELISNIIKSLEPQILKKKLQINNNINKEHIIKGEKFLLRHAFINLLHNAVNFSTEEGEIIITSEQDDKTVSIIITDTGTGIPDYAMDKIFNKFYSLPPKGSDKKSTGLGLSFVKEVAGLHNGTIKINNNAKAGVTAILQLPNK